MQQNTEYTVKKEADVNIQEQLEKYIVHWKWFALAIILSLLVAYIFLRYSTPLYKATSTIIVKDDKKGGAASEFAAFSDKGLLGSGKNNVDNEIEILKSRTLVEKTVASLKFNVLYINQGRVKAVELYKNVPIALTFSAFNLENKNKSYNFRIEYVSDSSYKLFENEDKEIGVFKYGKTINLEKGQLNVVKNSKSFEQITPNFSIDCIVHPIKNIAQNFKAGLSVTALSKNTSIIELSYIDPVGERAEDFLNALVEIYNADAIADKNLVSEKTSEFISQRLELITNELTDVEKNVEGFKRQNNLTDIPSEAGQFLESATEYEKIIIETQMQQNLVNSIIEFLKNSNPDEMIPTNILSGETEASQAIQDYNNLLLERNRIASNATLDNPVVKNLDRKIQALKQNVGMSLNRMKSSLAIKKRDLDIQGNIISGKKAQVPELERKFRIIDRQQKVKEALYLYLLQKREETALALAATVENAKVVDSALVAKTPVSPQKNIIFLIALLVGLVVPFIIIFIIDFLDNKIKTRKDIEERLMVPFIGDVPKSISNTELIQSNSRSSSAEALRIVRTNLDFMLNRVPEGRAKTIFVTSTFPKEGKTFIAVNLAGTFALSGKKVLLVGMDIRNPKFDEYLKLPAKGVTTFLSSSNLNLSELIVKQPDYENFYVIPAGVIPPNPAELLMGQKVDEMFEILKKEYDYIIVDTAPVGLVTDTILIAKNADTFIYVTRANYLDKRMLAIPEKLYKEGKLPNMAMLLNDTITSQSYAYSYGYGYGYGYGQEVKKEPWYKTIFKK